MPFGATNATGTVDDGVCAVSERVPALVGRGAELRPPLRLPRPCRGRTSPNRRALRVSAYACAPSIGRGRSQQPSPSPSGRNRADHRRATRTGSGTPSARRSRNSSDRIGPRGLQHTRLARPREEVVDLAGEEDHPDDDDHRTRGDEQRVLDVRLPAGLPEIASFLETDHRFHRSPHCGRLHGHGVVAEEIAVPCGMCPIHPTSAMSSAPSAAATIARCG
jgi:hypothetical protein